MTYVAQLRSRQSAEKAALARLHTQQKGEVATMIKSWTAQAAREKKELTARHNAQLPLTKRANKANNASEKAQLTARHKRERAQWVSYRKTLTFNQRLEKSNMAAKHKNDMAYAIQVAKKK